MLTTILIFVAGFVLGCAVLPWLLGLGYDEAVKRQSKEFFNELSVMEKFSTHLARQLGLMEAQRNHARWKNGVRKRKMREMRIQIASYRALISKPTRDELNRLTEMHIAQHEAHAVSK